jgi:hypothetical protein
MSTAGDDGRPPDLHDPPTQDPEDPHDPPDTPPNTPPYVPPPGCPPASAFPNPGFPNPGAPGFPNPGNPGSPDFPLPGPAGAGQGPWQQPGQPYGQAYPPTNAGWSYGPQGSYGLAGPMPQAPYAPRRTNSLAVASLVLSCCGIVPFIGLFTVILGVILGIVARGQIRRSGGVEGGAGLALAGIIVGSALLLLGLLIVGLLVFSVHSCSTTTGRC